MDDARTLAHVMTLLRGASGEAPLGAHPAAVPGHMQACMEHLNEASNAEGFVGVALQVMLRPEIVAAALQSLGLPPASPVDEIAREMAGHILKRVVDRDAEALSDASLRLLEHGVVAAVTGSGLPRGIRRAGANILGAVVTKLGLLSCYGIIDGLVGVLRRGIPGDPTYMLGAGVGAGSSPLTDEQIAGALRATRVLCEDAADQMDTSQDSELAVPRAAPASGQAAADPTVAALEAAVDGLVTALLAYAQHPVVVFRRQALAALAALCASVPPPLAKRLDAVITTLGSIAAAGAPSADIAASASVAASGSNHGSGTGMGGLGDAGNAMYVCTCLAALAEHASDALLPRLTALASWTARVIAEGTMLTQRGHAASMAAASADADSLTWDRAAVEALSFWHALIDDALARGGRHLAAVSSCLGILIPPLCAAVVLGPGAAAAYARLTAVAPPPPIDAVGSSTSAAMIHPGITAAIPAAGARAGIELGGTGAPIHHGTARVRQPTSAGSSGHAPAHHGAGLSSHHQPLSGRSSVVPSGSTASVGTGYASRAGGGHGSRAGSEAWATAASAAMAGVGGTSSAGYAQSGPFDASPVDGLSLGDGLDEFRGEFGGGSGFEDPDATGDDEFDEDDFDGLGDDDDDADGLAGGGLTSSSASASFGADQSRTGVDGSGRGRSALHERDVAWVPWGSGGAVGGIAGSSGGGDWGLRPAASLVIGDLVTACRAAESLAVLDPPLTALMAGDPSLVPGLAALSPPASPASAAQPGMDLLWRFAEAACLLLGVASRAIAFAPRSWVEARRARAAALCEDSTVPVPLRAAAAWSVGRLATASAMAATAAVSAPLASSPAMIARAASGSNDVDAMDPTLSSHATGSAASTSSTLGSMPSGAALARPLATAAAANSSSLVHEAASRIELIHAPLGSMRACLHALASPEAARSMSLQRAALESAAHCMRSAAVAASATLQLASMVAPSTSTSASAFGSGVGVPALPGLPEALGEVRTLAMNALNVCVRAADAVPASSLQSLLMLIMASTAALGRESLASQPAVTTAVAQTLVRLFDTAVVARPARTTPESAAGPSEITPSEARLRVDHPLAEPLLGAIAEMGAIAGGTSALAPVAPHFALRAVAVIDALLAVDGGATAASAGVGGARASRVPNWSVACTAIRLLTMLCRGASGGADDGGACVAAVEASGALTRAVPAMTCSSPQMRIEACCLVAEFAPWRPRAVEAGLTVLIPALASATSPAFFRVSATASMAIDRVARALGHDGGPRVAAALIPVLLNVLAQPTVAPLVHASAGVAVCSLAQRCDPSSLVAAAAANPAATITALSSGLLSMEALSDRAVAASTLLDLFRSLPAVLAADATCVLQALSTIASAGPVVHILLDQPASQERSATDRDAAARFRASAAALAHGIATIVGAHVWPGILARFPPATLDGLAHSVGSSEATTLGIVSPSIASRVASTVQPVFSGAPLLAPGLLAPLRPPSTLTVASAPGQPPPLLPGLRIA